MDKEQYNGWRNYATWRVNLELIDNDEYWHEYIEENFTEDDKWNDVDEDTRIYELSQAVESYVDELLFQNSHTGVDSIVASYASSFLGDVSWYQIAKHLLEDYAMQNI